MCSACGRVNARDARFCDWCGVQVSVEWEGGSLGGTVVMLLLTVCVSLCANLQPKKTIMDVMCRVCSAANNWQTRFCTSCKLLLGPPTRPSRVDRSSRWKVGHMHTFPSARVGCGAMGGVSLSFQVTDHPDGCVWYPVVEAEDEQVPVEVEEPVPTVEQGTQTHGYFKSARSMAMLESAAHRQQQVGADQHPAPAHVAAYSPGRGFWRQGLDHVAHHLRTHTGNCEEFQQSFGKLQIGKVCCVCVCVHVCVIQVMDVSLSLKLSSAAVSTTEGDKQATLTLTFELKEKAKVSGPLHIPNCSHNSVSQLFPLLSYPIPIQGSADNGQSMRALRGNDIHCPSSYVCTSTGHRSDRVCLVGPDQQDNQQLGNGEHRSAGSHCKQGQEGLFKAPSTLSE